MRPWPQLPPNSLNCDNIEWLMFQKVSNKMSLTIDGRTKRKQWMAVKHRNSSKGKTKAFRHKKHEWKAKSSRIILKQNANKSRVKQLVGEARAKEYTAFHIGIEVSSKQMTNEHQAEMKIQKASDLHKQYSGSCGKKIFFYSRAQIHPMFPLSVPPHKNPNDLAKLNKASKR